MDSELQVALIGAGAALVVLIVAYNKWQERKHRRRAEQAFKSDHRDVLLDPQDEQAAAARVEPSFDGESGGEREPSIGAAPSALRPVRESTVRRSVPEKPTELDARADCIIMIEAIEPLDTPRLWASQQEQLAGLSKPVRWYGFDDASNLWRELDAHNAGAYHWFCAAMQLVDRGGPIGEADFARFSGGIQRVAEQFFAVPAGLPARVQALGGATELDRFCADVDVQIGINVVAATQPFAGTKLRGLAEAEGMQLADDGSFHMYDEAGNTLFTLANLEPALFALDGLRSLQTHGITLVIDVPRVANGAACFERMMQLANHLADALQGVVVDDNRAPFGADAATMIRSQIAQFQERMASHDIPAGGPLARRLFAI
ncbi:ZipA [Azoarcus sp. DD4]|uniref:cell division protein ZipA C-terminal FtsZ-binding domain-containing protein n=1 Tax=Azoarcus sp. DD4 TaxID=2027405 RepID=UPI001126D407|nr:cell division protein ZipA C-terminal FtsZ-binding domain-containing protein [Azoarcus sp. DD4]QDF97387.1 ZipA [Azoarcus sp. DD4]